MFWNWTTGRRATPENLNGFKTAYKIVAEDRGGTTLTLDTDLFFTIQPLEIWSFQFNIFAQCTGTGDVKLSIGFPAGGACAWGALGGNLTTSTQYEYLGTEVSVSATTTRIIGMTGSPQLVPLIGTVFNGSTAGNVSLYWAMNALDGVNTASIRKGSNLIATRLE
jgi:hypothetical protein